MNVDGHAAQNDSHADKKLVSSVLENTATRKRKTSTHETEREPQPKLGGWSDKASGSSSKRQRVETNEANLNKIRAATQSGIYGSEMFASHVGRGHVICLTIVGSYDPAVWRE